MSPQKSNRAARLDLLVRSFARVPLGFKLLQGAIEPRNRSIFQMDIHQSRRFGEYFRIWPGSRDNEIEVLSVDCTALQLVLHVLEPRRRYTQEMVKRSWLSTAQVQERARSMGGRILTETRSAWVLELWTPDEERRYLCGRDDLRLFVAQIHEGTRVEEAHESLKPGVVKEADVRWPGMVSRQGEWFFLPLLGSEALALHLHLRDHPRAIRRLRPVGPGNRSHVADEVVKIDRRIQGRRRVHRAEEVYARGAVRHPDHRPLHLEDWRKVVQNREKGATTRRRLRLLWID